MSYNDIVLTRIDTGSPITQDLMTDLRDNPIGIATGDDTAPRVQKEAFKSTLGANTSSVEPFVNDIFDWTTVTGGTTVNFDFPELLADDFSEVIFLFRNVGTSISSGLDIWEARIRLNSVNAGGDALLSVNAGIATTIRGFGSSGIWDKTDGILYQSASTIVGTAGTRITGLNIVCAGGVRGDVKAVGRYSA